MESRWHCAKFSCPRCNETAVTSDVSFASDSQILIQGLCMRCGIQLMFRTTCSEQICHAYQGDLDEEQVKTLPLRPRLTRSEIESDQKFLKEMGIRPPGTKK